MREPVQTPQRCAIYTRKPTEHNLDLAFNALDAHRDACEVYIKSQPHEGGISCPDTMTTAGCGGLPRNDLYCGS